MLLECMPQVAIKEVIIEFESLEAISHFKHECSCNDFYVDRDALTIVGFFKQEHIELAVVKFGAELRIMSR